MVIESEFCNFWIIFVSAFNKKSELLKEGYAIAIDLEWSFVTIKFKIEKNSYHNLMMHKSLPLRRWIFSNWSLVINFISIN